MGNIQFDYGDFFGSQETVLSSLRYLNKNVESNHNLLSLAYNTIANSTAKLKQFDDAIRYFKLAIEFTKDPEIELKYKNNLSVCLRDAKKYDEAINLSQSNLQKSVYGSRDYAMILNNLAKAKNLQNPEYNPLNDYWLTLKIRVNYNDLWGLNSSYSSLAQFYTGVEIDSALYYSKKQYQIAKQLKSPDDQINALKRLIEYNGDNQRQYFTLFLELNDSIQQARAAAKNQFALIRYEVEKNKADNLRLEKENVEKQNRLVRQRAITGASIFLLLLAVGGGTLWYKRRKQRLELEAQNRVKETQLHLSKKIHDVVANGIYRVMSEIEHGDEVDRDGVLDKLENMYHQSRDISHDVEQKTITETPYNEQLASLLKSFAADHRRVLIAGNDAEQWDDISKRIKDEVKHVLQELMVNMKKHSQAEQVVIRFEKSEQKLSIFYKDNGVGISEEKSNGKGLANTVSRIESLGGDITFVNEPGKGLNITTIIPL
ncbi:tetratricopeptide repeat-containing sensor histidine kinase [Sphingobacterium siyangense]|uniref:tetratricopeptide repeat-containing sensor histidine kinase n=1 Tax=Sphingobacterium siyangense TaxID=459529 RepID=UPI0019629DC7|nr:ATP-binding protein [Sphingobacterium siyangense]QRY57291.1 ATP-binding protein [Sphingobacterium siyangense]